MLAELSPVNLVRLIGTLYRGNYLCRCKSVNWSIPLRTLQAVALGLGSKGIIGMCLGLSRNFKYFSSGAPDLLVLRISSAEEVIPIRRLLGEGWSSILSDGVSEEEVDFKKMRRDPNLSTSTVDNMDDDLELVSSASPVSTRPLMAVDLVVEDNMLFECAFIEVKGPTDRLSPPQITWLNLLAAHSVNAFVCRIVEDKLSS